MMCFLGWIDTSVADHDVLSYSQLQLIDGAMEITLTVTVKDDLSWTVHYRRNLVSRALIREISYPFQSGIFYSVTVIGKFLSYKIFDGLFKRITNYKNKVFRHIKRKSSKTVKLSYFDNF